MHRDHLWELNGSHEPGQSQTIIGRLHGNVHCLADTMHEEEPVGDTIECVQVGSLKHAVRQNRVVSGIYQSRLHTAAIA